MSVDLKNYRAPRPSWMTVFLVGALVAAVLTFVGPTDFANEVAIEAELKVMRAKVAAMTKERAKSRPAPMWCRRCERNGQPYYITSADGEPPYCVCTPEADLTKRRAQ